MFNTISYHYKINDKNILKILQFLCHVSKNVYNTALYKLRKEFFDNNKIMSYYDLNKLVMKCKSEGIEVEIINEAYTSKASALDKVEIKKGNYSGERIKRGLYQTKNGSIINADINGALNIIRKCNSNELNIQMSRGLTSPCRIHVRL